MSNKHAVRKRILERRNACPRLFVREHSAKIAKRLFSLPEFKRARSVLFYVSKGCEVDTRAMIRKAIRMKKKIIVPVSDTKRKKLILSELKNFSHLAPGAYRILEPRKEKIRKFPARALELAVVPGVAFDEKGARIGFGGGYFDKLLKKVRAPVLALAFDFQVVDEIACEPHDARVHKIITEKRVIDI
ncbi:MAG: 5-formyltetrahydrofolate cyclo-ligase [Candidatus Micrarchaeota archaeon]